MDSAWVAGFVVAVVVYMWIVVPIRQWRNGNRNGIGR
jgi:hypothetical protein